MAKIVSLIKPLNRMRGHAMASLFDDGDLLEFSRFKDTHFQAQDQAHTQERTGSVHPKSIFVSDWTNQELADLYRAYSLVQSAQPGLECDRGVSDEGDPWFLIGDDKGDVLVHICRIKRIYILDSVALSEPLKGADFNALIEDFLNSVVGEHAHDAEDAESLDHPKNVVRLARGGTVCLHPSVMIAALVWTLLMNADELTLPPSNGSTKKGSDQGQDKNQDAALLDIPDPMDFQVDLVKSGKADAGAYGFPDDLNTREISAQKDDKHLHVSAYSHALSTIAVAAGLYASSEAADAFWKSFTEASTGDALSSGMTKTNETNGTSVTLVDHLSDALALLSNVVDLVILESDEDFAGESHITRGEGTDTLSMASLETGEIMEASLGQQMLTKASNLSKNLAEASQTKTADVSGMAFLKTENILQAEIMAGSVYDNVSALNAQEQASGASMGTSIQGITLAYASSNVEVSHYNTSSFKIGLSKFNDELQKYSEIFEGVSLLTEEVDTGASEIESAGLGSSYFKPFDDDARSFIDSKIANSNLEVLVFNNEIIFVDKEAFSGNNTSVSWQLKDGGLVSMIGLSSDMAEFLVA